MSTELVYTSAPRGLKPNSSGFCTVAASAGMSRRARMKLEMLSGYELHFSLSDPKASLNPVNYAHTRVDLDGEMRSVLSRIAFAGAGYSGRSNKIAHHFLLDRHEQLPIGPAAMMLQMEKEGRFRSAWEGPPKELVETTDLTRLSVVAAPATAWRDLTGDAGHAGTPAQAFRENPKVPTFIVFNPGGELLPLFAESLAVLPENERWEVGFATYCTSVPVGCQYHWRGVLAGSSAENEMGRYPHPVVIRLDESLAAAADNEYTRAARGGGVVAVPVVPAFGAAAADVVSEDIFGALETDTGGYAVENPHATPATPEGGAVGYTPVAPAFGAGQRRRSSNSLLTLALTVGIIALIGVSVLLYTRLDDTRRRLAEKSKDVDELTEKVKALKKTPAAIGSKQLADLRRQRDRLDAQAQRLKSDNANLGNQVRTLRTQNAKLLKDLAAARRGPETTDPTLPPDKTTTDPRRNDGPIAYRGMVGREVLKQADHQGKESARWIIGAGDYVFEVGSARSTFRILQWPWAARGPRRLALQDGAEKGVVELVQTPEMKRLFGFSLKRSDGKCVLRLSRQALGKLFPGEVSPLVFEVAEYADAKPVAVYQCALRHRPPVVTKVLGFSKEGAPLAEISGTCRHPWPEALTPASLKGFGDWEQLKTSSRKEALWQCKARVESGPELQLNMKHGDGEATFTLSCPVFEDIAKDRVKLTAEKGTLAEMEERVKTLTDLRQEAKGKRDIALKNERAPAAREGIQRAYRKRVGELNREKNDLNEKRIPAQRKKVRDLEHGLETRLSAAGTTLDKARLEIVDPWGLPVVVVAIAPQGLK